MSERNAAIRSLNAINAAKTRHIYDISNSARVPMLQLKFSVSRQSMAQTGRLRRRHHHDQAQSPALTAQKRARGLIVSWPVTGGTVISMRNCVLASAQNVCIHRHHTKTITRDKRDTHEYRIPSRTVLSLNLTITDTVNVNASQALPEYATCGGDHEIKYVV